MTTDERPVLVFGAARFTDVHIRCRELGHAWDWQPNKHDVVKMGARVVGLYRVLTCLRCGSDRTETLSLETGERSHTKYSYADGYVAKGEGRVPVSSIRLELLRRVLQ
jgi:hypothetical protein